MDDSYKRFWSRVKQTDSCWLWMGYVNCYGYGEISVSRKTLRAHRFSWELTHGKIPTGLVLDHICRVRNCVNPKHLRAVTSRENVLYGEGLCAQNAMKTHCKAGHPFSGDNLRITPDGKRDCRACAREKMNRLRNKKQRSERAQ